MLLSVHALANEASSLDMAFYGRVFGNFDWCHTGAVVAGAGCVSPTSGSYMHCTGVLATTAIFGGTGVLRRSVHWLSAGIGGSSGAR